MPFAQGSDGGGSVRIPASVCGLVGLKTARGRISNGPLGGDLHGLSWNGPLARTVADCAALLDAMAGPDDRRPALGARAADDVPGGPVHAHRGGCGSAGTGPPRSPASRCTPTAWRPTTTPRRCSPGWGTSVVDVDCPFPAEALPLFTTLWSVSACACRWTPPGSTSSAR